MTTKTKTPFDAALILLARREHSQKEIRDKLSQKGHELADINLAIEQLIEIDYQSDTRFAHAYTRYRYMLGKGPVRIAQELSERGIAGYLIEDAIGNAELDWYAQAKDVRARKFGESPPADYESKARQMRFLQYRGFTHDQINESFSQ